MGHFQPGQSFDQYRTALDEETTFVDVEGDDNDDTVYDAWCGDYDDQRPQPEDPAWLSSAN
jgi:hypothetical protein